MKKKTVLISTIILLIIAGVVCYLVFKGSNDDKKYVTVSFDSDGGTEVASQKVEKGSKITLPLSTKEGYTLDGWYNGEEKVTGDTTYSENTTLKAKWLDEVKVFTVTFDSKGGSSVNPLTVKCDETLKLPQNPTKSGYTFGHWEDINGTPILEGALLACEDVTLYAKWNENEVTYSCPEGYELYDKTKCLSKTDFIDSCKSGWKLVNGECVNPSSPNLKGTRTCPDVYIEGHSYQGTKLEAGTTFCLYAPYESIKNQSDCEAIPNGLPNNGHYAWSGGKCYKARLQNYEITCAAGEKHLEAQVIAPGSNPGCYQVEAQSCNSGYTLRNNKCVKTIAATKN